MSKTFLGYRRPDGSVGIRNWVAVMSIMDNCNPVTRTIANSVNGTIPVTTLFVRGQIGWDLELAFDSLAGMGRNPNIAAVLLIGLEEKSTEEVARRIRSSGKHVETIHLQPDGTINAIAQGSRVAMRMVKEASRMRREPCPMSSLVIGVECGGSDTTSGLTCNPTIGRLADRLIDDGGTVIISETAEFVGAEHLFAERAVNDDVRAAFVSAVQELERDAMRCGVDLTGTNPAPDNIRGGLSTLEEKALGAMAKAGSRPLNGVLKYGESPRHKGLHFMDAPAPAVENLTAFAAAGAQMIFFGTGVGNPIGNMVAPTVKVCGNVNTLQSMADNIDVDVSEILENGASVRELGDRLYDFAADVASGTQISSEILDVRETAISRFERTL
jgi:altronate dehydratase large subunit